jgi:polysaccharide deacetylase family protein (PEP-CTERM system associated)
VAAGTRGASSIANVMSIDVEDYFQVSAFEGVVPRERWDSCESRVVGSTSRLLDLFAEYDVHATFFVLGWVAERHPALVRRIADLGHELASHSYWHRLVYDMTPDAFREDLGHARNVIQQAAGVAVRGFRAPSYSVIERSLWALDVLVEEGYAYDASIFPIRHDRYGIPKAPRHAYRHCSGGRSLLEVPGSTALVGTVRVPIGGGYFRLLPYATTRWAIGAINRKEQRPAVFYLHPWEIDPQQPRLQAGRVTSWRHYNGLEEAESRLRRLLADFRWDRLDRVMLTSEAA